MCPDFRGPPDTYATKKMLVPVFFYTSNLALSYQAAAFVLRCFDDRFRHAFEAFIRHVGFGYVDAASVAGGGKILASPEEESDRAFMLREITRSRTSITHNASW